MPSSGRPPATTTSTCSRSTSWRATSRERGELARLGAAAHELDLPAGHAHAAHAVARALPARARRRARSAAARRRRARVLERAVDADAVHDDADAQRALRRAAARARRAAAPRPASAAQSRRSQRIRGHPHAAVGRRRSHSACPPTSIVAMTRRVRGSMRETVPSIAFATHTAPSAAATPRGAAADGDRRPGRDSSARRPAPRVSCSPSVIHTAPAATADRRGGKRQRDRGLDLAGVRVEPPHARGRARRRAPTASRRRSPARGTDRGVLDAVAGVAEGQEDLAHLAQRAVSVLSRCTNGQPAAQTTPSPDATAQASRSICRSRTPVTAS